MDSVGERVRAIRDEIGDKQPAFAQRLSAVAQRMGLPVRFDNTMVSKVEIGRRELSIYEAAVVVAVDPQRRGWDWFILGERRPGRLKPRPGEAIAANGTERRRSGS